MCCSQPAAICRGVLIMDLSQLGGGNFRPTFFSGSLQVAAGVTGAIITLTAPAGKKVRLVALCAGAAEPNISVTAQGSAVVSNLTLSIGSGSQAGHFSVANNMSIGGAPSSNGLQYIESNTTIVVSKSGGNTANPIWYSYAYGD